ncbi:hypothetical protein BDW67DRAFT_187954 [Aspergillus spinulosporus]
MRCPLNYTAILAILLGTLLQATARTVPPAGLERERRAIIPGKTPAKNPTKGGAHVDAASSHSNGHDGPNSYVPGVSSAGIHSGKGGANCKRADGCNNDINPPDLNTLQIDIEHKTASAWIDWTPPEALVNSNQRKFRQNLRKVALNIYDRLWKSKEGVIDSSGTNLVAVLHVPYEGVFLSTIPREDASSAMLGNWQKMAPRLYDATDHNRVAEIRQPNSFHAEDGAIYQWEIRMSSASRDGPLRLPEGSQMLVFGKRGSYDRVPDVVPPCSGYTGRYPSCNQVLQRLGIRAITRQEAAE